MDSVITIAKDMTPLGVIALLAIVVYQLVKGKNVMTAIRGTQEKKYPEIEGFMEAIAKLNTQNETLLENHFKHEIPDMMNTLNRIDSKNDKIVEILTRIDTKLK